MIKSLRIGAAGVAIAATLGMSSAAHALTEQADATAEILESLTLTQDNGGLDFGVIAVTAAGTAVVDTAGAITCTPTNLVCTGTTTAADFTVTGNDGATVDITLPSTTTTLSNGTATMNVTALNLSAATATLTGGTSSFSIGGTLNVANGQAAGTYTGQFDVTVEYQ